MSSTTTKGVPYPVGSDAASSIDTIVQTLAEWVDGLPGVASLTTTQRDALSGATRWTGRVIWNSTNQRFEAWNGVAWFHISNGVQVLTTTQRDALSGANLYLGLVIYNTTLSYLQVYNGSAWKSILTEDDNARVALRVRRGANQTIANSTNAAISWDTETEDTENNFTPHATTATVITVAKAGLYMLFVQITSAGDAAPEMSVSYGGVDYRGHLCNGYRVGQMNVPIVFAAEATFSVTVQNDSGSSATYTGELTLVRVSR